MTRVAYLGADIFDGEQLLANHAVLRHDDQCAGIIPSENITADYSVIYCDGGVIMPDFVDLQVNGGGGVMFNDETTVGGVNTIAEAHRQLGTRALLPTLITDTPDKTRAAIDAVEAAITGGTAGVLGIHLEGPHLSVSRKGAHDPGLIRPMEDADEALLCEAAQRLPNVLVTLAPESVSPNQIKRLTRAGVIVSLGHSDCNFETAQKAFSAGATGVTHLYNAMSQMQNRAPGLVGAALSTPDVAASLIADGIHVHPANMKVALSANESVFLVSDAMATAGSDIAAFELNGRTVLREDGRLMLEDGTLAGADLDLAAAISKLIDQVGATKTRAYRMATSLPASCLRNAFGYGTFVKGGPWHGIRLDRNGRYKPLNDNGA